MKLLACQACACLGPVGIQLDKPIHCPCGKSWAVFTDALHVLYDGPAVILGYPNGNLDKICAGMSGITEDVPLLLHIIPLQDGVLRPHEFCIRCPPGATDEMAWQAHFQGKGAPPPFPGPREDGKPSFRNRARPTASA